MFQHHKPSVNNFTATSNDIAIVQYLAHTEAQKTVAELARQSGEHSSTVLRRIQKLEGQRDDPLFDEAMSLLAKRAANRDVKPRGGHVMTAITNTLAEDPKQLKEAVRILRRLCETNAFALVGEGLEKAAIMRTQTSGEVTRIAVTDRDCVKFLILKDWIACATKGKIAKYEVTEMGRKALRRALADQKKDKHGPYSDALSSFSEQHKDWGEKTIGADEDGKPKRMRFNLAESPLTGLGRRKGTDGKPYLNADLIAAGERLREDFEMAQMGPRVAQNWDRFMISIDSGSYAGGGEGNVDARVRLRDAMKALGPGLSDVALRCCCFLEGLETAEKRLGWSARSGKVVLKIALQRLHAFYEERHAAQGRPLIG